MKIAVLAHTVACIEYERGWGSKVDGYIAFDSKEALDRFVKDHYSKRTNGPVPDYYVNYEYVGEKPVPAKCVERLYSKGMVGYD